jgi:hypothetical protein
VPKSLTVKKKLHQIRWAHPGCSPAVFILEFPHHKASLWSLIHISGSSYEEWALWQKEKCEGVQSTVTALHLEPLNRVSPEEALILVKSDLCEVKSPDF